MFHLVLSELAAIYKYLISFYLFSIKVQCKWSVWTRWSKCSKSCGGGSQKRRRTIARTAKHGGKRCDGSNTARQSCNVKKCPGMINIIYHHIQISVLLGIYKY